MVYAKRPNKNSLGTCLNHKVREDFPGTVMYMRKSESSEQDDWDIFPTHGPIEKSEYNEYLFPGITMVIVIEWEVLTWEPGYNRF